MTKPYLALVEKIVPKGNHGPYAVARHSQLGVITFSLEAPIWQETEWPEPGTYVVLERILKKRQGWRAKYGRSMGPADDEEVDSKQ